MFGRVIAGSARAGEEEAPVEGPVAARLLVPSSQIGCLLGKGGAIITQMRLDTGAGIRVLPRDQVPGCALPTDEVVQVVGEIPVVRKTLELISIRLRANPVRVPPHAPPPGPMQHMGGAAGRGGGEAVEVVFRLLCPGAKMGAVIGYGGGIIQSVRDETGARIKIADEVAACPERVVIISSTEVLSQNHSPACEALFRLQSQILEPEASAPGAILTSRLLVPADQIGCLLGRGGAIISELRRTSRANVRILGKTELPECALSSDEAVQILGDVAAVRNALHQVAGRLRKNPPRDRPLLGQQGSPSPAHQVPPPGGAGAH